ncbi:hypothetical protein CFC21_005528 [Triticum aestivum]|uniref:Uncharacterized protein n=2 Tax=Triticum aestivum TaxID=4565 RepID=A0A3B5YSG0_WHEAT|nr:AP-3 complex subunit beta-2-like [Triticum aestivum]XP_044365315.1 AP-3 complex subunit beta-2-like [Triticum aestivum]XP_044365320.1 AP-3 complex subunit beta-2-like [Triticum aestivum]KAF6987935.1 hypothetical protein CFC21_005528 [Triticum aestivum]
MASPQSSYGSSEEDASSDGSDHQVVEKQPLREESEEETGGNEESEEKEEEEEGAGDNVVPDDNNIHQPPLQGDTVPDSESPPRSQPKRKAVDAEPVEHKRMRSAEAPQPRMQPEAAEVTLIQPEVAEHALTKSDAEKLFQVKIDFYWHLGQEVLALEEKHPGLFKSSFLKLPDEKARTLNAKLQKQQIAKLKALLWLADIRKEVTNSLINCLD